MAVDDVCASQPGADIPPGYVAFPDGFNGFNKQVCNRAGRYLSKLSEAAVGGGVKWDRILGH